MNLRIIVDKTKLVSIENGQIYKTELDYFKAYSKIKKSIANQESSIIICYSKALADWLKKGFSHYSGVDILYEEINYKILLAKKWNIEYDIELTENEIIDNKLIELEVENEKTQKISDTICDKFISPLLNNPTKVRTNFGKILADLEIYYNQKTQPQIFNQILSSRIRNIIKLNPNDPIITLLENNFTQCYELCCINKIVRHYPKLLRENCLQKKWSDLFTTTKYNLEKLNLNRFIHHSDNFETKVIVELSLYYKNLKIEDKETLNKIIANSSGIIKEEFTAILEKLKDNLELIDNKIIIALRSKFRIFAKQFEDEINELNDLIPVLKPSEFSVSFDFTQAVDWARNEYLPYKFWVDSAGFIDKDIFKEGEKFADLFYSHYEKTSYHSENYSYRFLHKHLETIKDNDTIIILILDNFNYRYLKLLKSALLKNNFIIKKESPFISLLPTETEISKPSIINGSREKIQTTKNYEKIFIDTWSSYFPSYNLHYVGKLNQLNEIELGEKNLILINYLQIDKELHQAYEKTNVEHKKIVKFYLTELSNTISKFWSNNNIKNNGKILFISDHGSTLIDTNLPNNIDVNYFKRFNSEPSHRFLKLSNDEFSELKDNKNISDELYFIDKNLSGNDENYIIAKGYNRFKDIGEKFFVHGGLLPEEIIVPGGSIELLSEITKPIIVNLKKDKFRYLVKEAIQLRVANPNDISIKDLVIEVSSDDFVMLEVKVEELKPAEDSIIEEEIKIRNDKLNELRIHFAYSIGNEILSEERKFPIQVKKFVQQSIDLENF